MAAEILKPPAAETEATAPMVALFIAASAMAAGVWFGYLAWRLDSFPYSVTAVVLLLLAPALAVAAILARNVAEAADERTPALELLDRLQRLDVSLRAVQLARAHIYVGASYAIVLGICQATGLINSRDFVLFYAAAMLVAASGYLPWTQRQEARLHALHAQCRQLLGDRKAARALVFE